MGNTNKALPSLFSSKEKEGDTLCLLNVPKKTSLVSWLALRAII